jgi:hypothetical protein
VRPGKALVLALPDTFNNKKERCNLSLPSQEALLAPPSSRGLKSSPDVKKYTPSLPMIFLGAHGTWGGGSIRKGVREALKVIFSEVSLKVINIMQYEWAFEHEAGGLQQRKSSSYICHLLACARQRRDRGDHSEEQLLLTIRGASAEPPWPLTIAEIDSQHLIIYRSIPVLSSPRDSGWMMPAVEVGWLRNYAHALARFARKFLRN